jgi:hypothetical protein
VLHNLPLGPSEEVEVGIPVWPCAQLGGREEFSYFDVKMRFATFTRTVQLPWGMFGDALILRGQGGEPGAPGTFCLPGTVLPPMPPRDDPPSYELNAISGVIVRIHHHSTAGDLRLTRLPGPDADLGFNSPDCMVSKPHGERVANFDLNWAAIPGQRSPSPTVRLSIIGPHGEPVTALIPQGPEYTALACRAVRNLILPAQRPGARLIIGLVMRRPKGELLKALRLVIDGHSVVLPLTPACPGPICFNGRPTIRYQLGTAYSHALRI